eukprot:TRINITY_DN4114_c0_g3_i1.p2 TRINITY_DN4114_c0_g3~~TRINITY_DN4114_c0_g3_i1.p2  ORF type:complete len:107 (+),score=29.06 TRINITY_DN4114_c0_g3_i1:73-393(+)
MAARRAVLLPVVLAVAACFVFSQTFAFAGNSVQPSAALRSTTATASHALPIDMAPLADASSVTTALQVSGAAYIFNILILVFPCAFLVFLFLYSERTLSDEEKSAA